MLYDEATATAIETADGAADENADGRGLRVIPSIARDLQFELCELQIPRCARDDMLGMTRIIAIPARSRRAAATQPPDSSSPQRRARG